MSVTALIPGLPKRMTLMAGTETARGSVNEKRSGWLYYVQDSLGRTKIGATRNLPTRLKALKTSASELHLIQWAWCDDVYRVEAGKHDFWSDLRLEGEWFNLPEQYVSLLSQFPMYYPDERDDDACFECVHNDIKCIGLDPFLWAGELTNRVST